MAFGGISIMEKVDTLNAGFTAIGMSPELGDEVVVPWGRKIVYNLVNGYGIVGTVSLNTASEIGIDLALTKKFQLPPQVYLYIQTKSEGIQEIPRSNYLSLNSHWMSQPAVTYVISGDHIIFRSFVQTGSLDSLKARFDFPLTVYFRIHGV